MPLALQEIGLDHRGHDLPSGICACIRRDTGALVAFKVRWRQEDDRGYRHQPSKSFSVRKLGSPDRALDAATFFLSGTTEAALVYRRRPRRPKPKSPTANDVFTEWMKLHASQLSRDYAERMSRLWEKDIAPRSFGQARLDEISANPSFLVHSQDELIAEEMGPCRRREIWKLFQAVLRWGRRRHPDALTIEVSGLIEIPKYEHSRLAYVADAVGLERIIEAILMRPARDPMLPLRDAALVAAMGFTVAARPSEWRLTATWDDIHDETIELQRPSRGRAVSLSGLKRGAHVALLLPNAHDRLMSYRRALEARHGPQPGHALVFQVLGQDGPIWVNPEGGGKPIPLAWTKHAYNQWVRRVWGPARAVASQAPDAPPGLAGMTFLRLPPHGHIDGPSLHADRGSARHEPASLGRMGGTRH